MKKNKIRTVGTQLRERAAREETLGRDGQWLNDLANYIDSLEKVSDTVARLEIDNNTRNVTASGDILYFPRPEPVTLTREQHDQLLTSHNSVRVSENKILKKTNAKYKATVETDLLKKALRTIPGLESLPEKATIYVRVPGGGDWANSDLYFEDDIQLQISWEEES